MAKTVEIRVDPERSSLEVGNGRLFLGTVSGIRLEGWLPNEGHEPVLTMFPHDCGTPLAQSRVEDGVLVLDLTGDALRRAFRCAPARHQFALYLNQRGGDGRFLPDVEAVGTVFVDWSPEVFDVGTGEVATLKGPPGNPGADGLSAYELAVANGYRGTVGQWLLSLKGADGEPGAPGVPGADGASGASAYEIALRNGFSGTESEWLESLMSGVKSVNNRTGVVLLVAKDVGAVPLAREPESDSVSAYVSPGDGDETGARMFVNSKDGGQASLTVAGVPGTSGVVVVGNTEGGRGDVRVGRENGEIKVGTNNVSSGVVISGREREVQGGDSEYVGLVEVNGSGASIRKNGKEVATEEQVASVRNGVDALKNSRVELSGEYEDGTAFGFEVLKKGE